MLCFCFFICVFPPIVISPRERVYCKTRLKDFTACFQSCSPICKTGLQEKSRVKGQFQEDWLVLHYGDVAVHLFSSDPRK
jgi:ribosomal silencing factor RsfS